MDKKQFMEYIDHFNNKRYDKVTGYFAPDITVEYFDDPHGSGQSLIRTLHGPDEFIANYKELHAYTNEALELRDFIVNSDLVFAELYTEFYTFKDTPSSSPWVRKKGDITIQTNWVLYNMAGDKMRRIRIAHFRNHDPKTVKLFK